MAMRTSTKSKGVALLLCFFLWFIGVHDFYLGRTLGGVIYLVGFLLFGVLLGWLIIPLVLYALIGGLIAFIEFVMLIFMSGADFDRKYNGIQ